ncbi:MAG: FAD-dependent oxidoreductase [Methylococcaceae bacterium]|nr:FAD-dependent oxidoreductase [Methylococcaceae bacterium]
MQVDFLIIGQGLAGSLLGWTLLQRGCSVVVVDNSPINASSVAAGIINPISGMRLAKSADVDTLLPAATACYDKLSGFFGESFYVRKSMFRLFQNESERVQALKRQQNPDYDAFLGEFSSANGMLNGFNMSYGYIEQLQCGYLSTALLLSSLKNFFIASNAYCPAFVEYAYLNINSAVKWQAIVAKQVVFCEGYRAIDNPWFNNLPLQPVKGEILTLNHPAPLPDSIINYGNWLLPQEDGNFRIGATFDRYQTDQHITEQGKQRLFNALKTVHPGLAQSSVVKHEVGIRPCTADRHPFIGRHPQHKALAIFNGFGAKGSLQIPWYSERFADYLLHNRPLPFACDIERFQSPSFSR